MGCVLWFSAQNAWCRDFEGTVRMNGIPKPRYGGVQPQERQACGGIIKKVDNLIVGQNGELKNAVVWVEGDFSAAEIARAGKNLSPASVVIDQTRCQFEPRVVLISPGGEVFFRSMDPVMHHVAGYFPNGKIFFENILKDQNTVVRRSFDQPGPYLMRCGFHPWMGAVVYVRKHPFYAVTDEKGKYKISGAPNGNYRLAVWHETLGQREFAVNSGGITDVVFDRPK